MVEPFAWIGTYRLEGERALKEGHVREIEFSDSTYQIAVFDPQTKESYWTFFQFNDEGRLKDAFCSCPLENDGCPHLSAAHLKIFNYTHLPLHVRFEKSFWNRLATIFAEHTGYDDRFLQKIGEGHYLFEHDVRFEIEAKNSLGEHLLSNMIEHRSRETPENSIKFSNLSQQEVLHWREGRPSPEVRYRLSFWSDLAKWMMLSAEEHVRYSIVFKEDSSGFPTEIQLEWEPLSITWNCKLSDLTKLIPTLETVKSPLKVFHESEGTIQAIKFLPETRELIIKRNPLKLAKEVEQKIRLLGDWAYLPGKGFMKTTGSLLESRDRIEEHELPTFLERYGDEISNFIPVHSEAIPVSYAMHFDEQWQLHFNAYLFEKGDLQKAKAHLFKEWVYLPGKGFYRIKGLLFDSLEAILAPEEVSPFVNQHKVWLNGQLGFQTHLANLESQLAFSLSPEGILSFHAKEPLFEEDSKDFEEWIYYAKQGFFSRQHMRSDLIIHPGLTINPGAISSFIKANKEELETVPGFFSPQLPLMERGVEIEARSETSLIVKPVYKPIKAYSEIPLRFFGDFVFIPQEGFHELPVHLRIPPPYDQEQVIAHDRLSAFFAEDYPVLKKVILKSDPRLNIPLQTDLEVDYLVRTPSGKLKANLFILTEQGKTSVADIFEAFEKKRRYLFSEGGMLDLQKEEFQWIKRLKQPVDPETKMVELSVVDFLRLDASLNLLGPPPTASMEGITRQLLKELRLFSTPEVPFLKGLKSELRLYQKTGLQWLWFLYQNGLSGLLCDDMGLGKTHQAMALIASVLNQKKEDKRFLVVCPTSVIYHWQDKLSAFLPDIKVHVFHGLKRTLEDLPPQSLLLTSYGVLRVEREKIGKIPFELAIFDEIQIAKNARSRVHHALAHVHAKMRLGLTGTPIENNLLELKALFDLVLPGYLPSEARFREFFLAPIEKEQNEEKKALLGQLIRPFVLRRRKTEVLQELPEKSIDKAFCDLSSEQASLYQKTLNDHRDKLIARLADPTTSVPFVPIFALLSQLKQICDHPALFAKDPKNYRRYSSGKWDLFVELLDEARESQQKVVIFSQYLSMLDIIEEHVKEKGWGYAQIRGDTMDRRGELKRFQEDPDCVVFLGSLQAAGLGIDLTAANVVILYDRWWNAARENQAIDRVHRIGQKWGVQVFKLITKETIEEKIDHMITRKGRLLEEVVSAEDESVFKRFTREELLELLSFGETAF